MDVRLVLMVAFAFVAYTQSKPIMVSFGTKGGPIVPPTPSTTTLNPLAPKNPAPVYEQVDDIPPPVYRPPTPNQYRNLINSYKPNPNLQLGTPLDIKYQNLNTLSQLQVQQQKAEIARQQGLSYNGAQVFGVQAYEYDNARQRQQQNQQVKNQLTNAQKFVQQYVPSKNRQVVQPQPNVNQNQNQQKMQPQQQQENARYQRHEQKDQTVYTSNQHNVYKVQEQQRHFPQQQQQQQQQQYQYRNNNNYNNYQENQVNQQDQQQSQSQSVPAIGIAYSSGLRYYVPQFYYYDSRHHQQQQQQQQSYQPRPKFAELPHNAIY